MVFGEYHVKCIGRKMCIDYLLKQRKLWRGEIGLFPFSVFDVAVHYDPCSRCNFDQVRAGNERAITVSWPLRFVAYKFLIRPRDVQSSMHRTPSLSAGHSWRNLSADTINALYRNE